MFRSLPLLRGLTFVLLFAGSIAISAASISYLHDEMPPFLIEKLPLPRQELWLLALRVHVVAAALALPGCLLLSLKTLLRRAPRLHRWMGRVIGGVILLALAPAGFYLALFAKGGLPSTLGFLLSGIVVVAAMVQGIHAARAGNYRLHRYCMLHVFAQLSVAVTSRALLVLFAALNIDETSAYLLALWLPVILSACVVEKIASSGRNHEKVHIGHAPVRFAGVGTAAHA